MHRDDEVKGERRPPTCSEDGTNATELCDHSYPRGKFGICRNCGKPGGPRIPCAFDDGLIHDVGDPKFETWAKWCKSHKNRYINSDLDRTPKCDVRPCRHGQDWHGKTASPGRCKVSGCPCTQYVPPKVQYAR